MKLLLFQKYPLLLCDLQVSKEKRKESWFSGKLQMVTEGLEKDLIREVMRMDITQHEI